MKEKEIESPECTWIGREENGKGEEKENLTMRNYIYQVFFLLGLYIYKIQSRSSISILV